MRNASCPRPEYPRPDFRRDSFENLNGPWEFAFDDQDAGIREGWWDQRIFDQTIIVPYAYQSKLSGIHEKAFHNVVWYKRRLRIVRDDPAQRVLLHIGAADWEARLWVNGRYQGEHRGGHTPFTFDITDALREDGENIFALRVRDDALDLELPRGKQYWKAESHGIFYTGTTGVWQTVWLEKVDENRLEKIWITPDVDRKCFSLRMEFAGSGEKQARVRLSLKGKCLADDTVTVFQNRCQRDLWLDQRIMLNWNFQESMVWTPRHPVLFDLIIDVLTDGRITDQVTSYCAMRKVSVVNGQFMLNNRPFYQKMLLDQGYWPDSLMTASTDGDFIRDIEACKAMGFNGVRKHQKAEDPRYLYHADRLGFLVWGECASAYVYSRQSALRLTEEWTQIVQRDYNHPCIVCWVPLNESWGVDGIMNNPEEQSFSQSLYYLTKALDQTRPVVSNDGWNHTKSDLFTIHDYTEDADKIRDRYSSIEHVLPSMPGHRTLYSQGHAYGGEPLIVSEFGGIAFRQGKEKGWGYSEAVSEEDFLRRYGGAVGALLASPLVQGFVYTQLCDVEQEINGLMTYDRRFKAPPEKIRALTCPDEKEEEEEEEEE